MNRINFAERELKAAGLDKPLTGDDSEWFPLDDTGLQQNRRCPTVFKYADGSVYDVGAIIFEEPNGAWYTNRKSRVLVTFPYTREVKVVKVDEEGNPVVEAHEEEGSE